MENGKVDTRQFVRGLETTRLIDLIKSKMDAGIDTISYEELSREAGGSVQQERRGNLVSAMRTIQKVYRVLWVTERLVGIRRCRGAEVIGAAKQDYSKCRSAARKALGKLAVGEYHEFSNADKVSHNALAAALGAIGQFAKESAVRRIAKAISPETPVQPRLTEVLDLFNHAPANANGS